jgi:hypothetical protein
MTRAGRLVGGLGAALVVALVGACGGGGSSSSSSSGGAQAQTQADSVVVGFDHNGDGALDLLTLDLGTEPLTIVEGLEGDGQGAYTDQTSRLKGDRIDATLSTALKSYLAGSLKAGEETQLELVDSSGSNVTVIVYQ